MTCDTVTIPVPTVDADFDAYILDLIDAWKATYPGALILLWSGSFDLKYESIFPTSRTLFQIADECL